jgi:hypothetical protein
MSSCSSALKSEKEHFESKKILQYLIGDRLQNISSEELLCNEMPVNEMAEEIFPFRRDNPPPAGHRGCETR